MIRAYRSSAAARVHDRPTTPPPAPPLRTVRRAPGILKTPHRGEGARPSLLLGRAEQGELPRLQEVLLAGDVGDIPLDDLAFEVLVCHNLNRETFTMSQIITHAGNGRFRTRNLFATGQRMHVISRNATVQLVSLLAGGSRCIVLLNSLKFDGSGIKRVKFQLRRVSTGEVLRVSEDFFTAPRAPKNPDGVTMRDMRSHEAQLEISKAQFLADARVGAAPAATDDATGDQLDDALMTQHTDAPGMEQERTGNFEVDQDDQLVWVNAAEETEEAEQPTDGEQAWRRAVEDLEGPTARPGAVVVGDVGPMRFNLMDDGQLYVFDEHEEPGQDDYDDVVMLEPEGTEG